jgi:hypothetical protein
METEGRHCDGNNTRENIITRRVEDDEEQHQQVYTERKEKNKNRKRQKKVSRLHEKPMTAVYRASTAEELYALSLSLSAPVGFF